MMDVKQQCQEFSVAQVVTALLYEFSAVTHYKTLRDNLPRRLAQLLCCRGTLIYLRSEETLQLVSGSFDDHPGWSTKLLQIAHINPIPIHANLPEGIACRERRSVEWKSAENVMMAMPLVHRHLCIGILVVAYPSSDDLETLPSAQLVALEAIAGVVALLLENTRLLERDRERIRELSLLNSISSQMHTVFYDLERLRSVVLQRTREICAVDLCDLLELERSTDVLSWVTPQLHECLCSWGREQRSCTPLLIERPGTNGDALLTAVLEALPASIKTLFVFPLCCGRPTNNTNSWTKVVDGTTLSVCGLLIGGYYRTRKLYHEELALLQVLATQASSALENMYLLHEVIEARNESRRLLRQVLEDQRLKESIVESVPSGLITIDLQGRIQTFNRAAATILGYHPFEVLGRTLTRFLPLEGITSSLFDKPVVVPSDQQSVSPQIGVSRQKIATQDRFERARVLDVELVPLFGECNEVVGTLITFTDLTSVHNLEEEKRRLDRLASLGQMAANVAHEVRNPLASIKTTIQLLRDELMEETTEPIVLEDIQHSITVVLKEVERLDSIVRDLLLFARPRQTRRIQTDLLKLCDQVIDLLQDQCQNSNVEIHRVYEEIPLVSIDIGQMEQVLLNLLINAIQAMPDGGIVTVTCRLAMGLADLCEADLLYQQQSEELSLSSKAAFQQLVEFIIQDTGVGMTADQLEYIFQPFYTTKAHGIGLGLPITRRLIEDHGGTIRIESQYGYGATIIVRLPIPYEYPLTGEFERAGEGL